MSLFDLLRLSLENLGRRKGRVTLTAIGVVIGTAAVVVLVSLGMGLQRNAAHQLGGIGDLTQIQVMPTYGEEYYAEVGGYVAVALPAGPADSNSSEKLITRESLVELGTLEGVISVAPRDHLQGSAIITHQRLESWITPVGVEPDALERLGITAAEGSTELQKGTAVVGAMVAQGFYDPRWRPGQQTPQPPDLMGQTVKLTLLKWSQEEGAEIRKSVPVRIVGVLAEARGEPDWSVYMHLEEVTSFNEWMTGRRIDRTRDSYPMVIVRVEDVSHVLDVYDQIVALGYQAHTPQSFVQGINSFFLVLQIVFGGVGAIALLVAAIGIANTMTMAILERTREIGLMKAVGATNRDVLGVFLSEAAGIGFLGGVGGIALGWTAGQVINVLALAYLAGQAAETGGPPPMVAVYTPLWLPVVSLIFATLVGTLSGLYPALRAATLVPVNALKYE